MKSARIFVMNIDIITQMQYNIHMNDTFIFSCICALYVYQHKSRAYAARAGCISVSRAHML